MSHQRRRLGLDSSSVGLVLGRRDALVAAALFPLGCARPPAPREAEATVGACVLDPENVEGPFYLDDAHVRSDVREDRQGLTLVLDLTALDAATCKPVTGAAVDIWHCDAAGAYSGFADGGMHPPHPGGPNGVPPPGPPPFDPDRPPPPRPTPTDGARFLRGVQLSGAAGRVRFTTVYPGWYAGRAVHIHVRVRAGGAVRGETYGDGHVAHTGQLFFPEAVSDAVFARSPYAAHAGRRTLQSEDGIFGRGGSGGMLALATEAGDLFTATATLAIDQAARRAPMR